MAYPQNPFFIGLLFNNILVFYLNNNIELL